MIHIKELRSLPALSHAEHCELFAKYKAGDIEARNQIIESVLKLAVRTVNKYPMSSRYRDDVLSEAFLRLVVAIDGWDGKRPLVKYLNAILWNVCTTKWSNLNIVYMNPSTARQVNKTLDFHTAEEIAEHFKVSLKRAREILSARGAMNPCYYQSNSRDDFQSVLEIAGRIKYASDKPCLADLEPLTRYLPRIQREVFAMRVGLRGEVKTTAEVCKKLKITRQEASTAMQLAKKMIRRIVFLMQSQSGQVTVETKNCELCGGRFIPGTSGQRFCGVDCRSRKQNSKPRKKRVTNG